MNNNIFQVLSKGLKFCPVPDIETQIDQTIKTFKKLEVILNNKFKNCLKPYQRSGGKYPKLDHLLNSFSYIQREQAVRIPGLHKKINEIIRDIKLAPEASQNLENHEKQNLHYLAGLKNFIIKGADKGPFIVVLTEAEYTKEAERQLVSDNYEICNTDNTSIIDSLVDKVSSLFRELKELELLSLVNINNYINKSYTLPHMYLLPKVHKPETEIGTIEGRPIISGMKGPNKALDKVIEFFINPLMNVMPNLLKDTKDLLLKLEGQRFPIHACLITLDVKSLYPSIPHVDGIEALYNVYDNNLIYLTEYFQKQGITLPSPSFIKRSVAHIIYNNYFTFNERTYLQQKGTAMGSNISVTYANSFMFEHFDLVLKEDDRFLYFRYIDDILLVWLADLESFPQFIEEINRIHPSIKFTYSNPSATATFLDLNISLSNGNISYNTHTKNLRNHYLNASSCHPEHIIENIPYTEALRYSRNNSDRDYLQIQLEALFKDLLSNGYKTNNIRTKFGRALLKERNLKITKKPTKKKKIKEQSVFLKVPYHPTTAPIIKKKLKNIMRWLESTYAGASWKSNFPTKIITSNKLPPKIGEILKN